MHNIHVRNQRSELIDKISKTLCGIPVIECNETVGINDEQPDGHECIACWAIREHILRNNDNKANPSL